MKVALAIIISLFLLNLATAQEPKAPEYSVFQVYVQTETEGAQGTGFFIGYEDKLVIVTNWHVCTAYTGPSLQILLVQGKDVYKTKILKVESKLDLCALEVPLDVSITRTPFKLATRDVKDLEDLVSIGYPHGEFKKATYLFNFQPGTIEMKYPGGLLPVYVNGFIVPTIGGGASGSPMILGTGEVVGVYFGGNSEIGFFKPVSYLSHFLKSL